MEAKSAESPLLAKRGEDLGEGIEPQSTLNTFCATTDKPRRLSLQIHFYYKMKQ
jgi:hypothetical protein